MLVATKASTLADSTPLTCGDTVEGWRWNQFCKTMRRAEHHDGCGRRRDAPSIQNARPARSLCRVIVRSLLLLVLLSASGVAAAQEASIFPQLGVHSVRAVAFSGDGRFLATAGVDSVVVWDLASRRELRSFGAGEGGPQGTATSLSLSPDGLLLASARNNGTVAVWSVKTGQIVAKLTSSDGARMNATAVSFSPDGRWLASDLNGETSVWYVGACSLGGQYRQPVTDIWMIDAIAFSPDGKSLVLHHLNDGATTIWSRVGAGWSPLEPGQVKEHPELASSCLPILISDGKAWALGHKDGDIEILNSQTGTMLRTLRYNYQVSHSGTGNPHAITNLVFLDAGNRLVATSSDGTAVVWDVNRARPLRTIDGPVTSIALSPDQTTLAVGKSFKDEDLSLLVLESWSDIHFLKAKADAPSVARFSPDSQVITTASWGTGLQLWDARTGDLRWRSAASDPTTTMIGAVDFSPDGKLMV